jgi:hypothetical protein
MHNPAFPKEQNFFTYALPANHIGVTGNKMKLAKGEATQKINSALMGTKKVKSKSISKPSAYINHLRDTSPLHE